MPELPEVETLRRSLVRKVKGKKIVDLTITLSSMVRRFIAIPELIRRVRGNTVVAVKRRGKSLLFILDTSDVMIVRLGMTGQLIWSLSTAPSALINIHTSLSILEQRKRYSSGMCGNSERCILRGKVILKTFSRWVPSR